ncbi:MAG: epimerase [Pseudomonadota bacterium]
MAQKVLILGASGRFGRNAEIAFKDAGWDVRLFNRNTDDLKKSALDADVIINSWNPIYDKWESTVPQLTESAIEAAKINNATVIVPGNVYVFGFDAPEKFSEKTPYNAKNPLGRIRIEMEAAYRKSGVQTIILRGGDFIDTSASENWFDRVMIAKLDKGKFIYPGSPDLRHAWAYLPDMARAAVLLAEMRDKLAMYEDIPFPGYTLSGRELAKAVEVAHGKPLKLKRFNWLPVRLVSPFWKVGKHLLEMSYLWSKPHYLDAAKFDRLLPDFEHTSPQTAVGKAVSGASV